MAFELYYTQPGRGARVVPLNQSTLKVGSLLSNQIVIEGEGIEGIHALIEEENGQWVITNISENGIKINNSKVAIDAILKTGDVISLGDIQVTFRAAVPKAPLPPPPPPTEDLEESSKTEIKTADVPAAQTKAGEDSTPKLGYIRAAKDQLFTPRTAKAFGDMLEVVAYWDSRIIEIEHYHPNIKGWSKVSIGDPTKAHFLAAGDDDFAHYVMAEVRKDGYNLHLLRGMTARIRSGTEVKAVGEGSYRLGMRDISHVRYGPVHYFLNFAKYPELEHPPQGLKDPFLFAMTLVVMAFYSVLCLLLYFSAVPEQSKDQADVWSVVQAPEKIHTIPKPVEKPPVVIEKVKVPPPEPVKAPEPPPKVVPAPPKVAEKPKKEPPQPKAKPVQTLTQAKTQPVHVQPPKAEKIANFGNEKPGGVRLGVDNKDLKGVVPAPEKKPSGPNLSKLGLGVGKISTQTGPGAIHTNFKNSAGGAGSGSGSGVKTFGLGGLQASSSLGIAGAASAVSQFGGGKMVKENEIGGAFKGSRPGNVSVRGTDPLISGGLTQEEVQDVMSKNVGQVRHCYQKLLQKEPGAIGRLKVRFTIGKGGRVTTAEIEGSTFSDTEISTCITTVVKRWQFPSPRGADVKVTFPYLFNPVN